MALDGTGYLRTPTLPVSLTAAKTLVARVRVDPLTQGGGGVLTVQVPGGWLRFDRLWRAGAEEVDRWLGVLQPDTGPGRRATGGSDERVCAHGDRVCGGWQHRGLPGRGAVRGPVPAHRGGHSV